MKMQLSTPLCIILCGTRLTVKTYVWLGRTGIQMLLLSLGPYLRSLSCGSSLHNAPASTCIDIFWCPSVPTCMVDPIASCFWDPILTSCHLRWGTGTLALIQWSFVDMRAVLWPLLPTLPLTHSLEAQIATDGRPASLLHKYTFG